MTTFAIRPRKSAGGAARTPERSAIRRDVQGLRAMAVIAVVLNHFVGWPLGGFTGVDVFFVISGFLITGMLLREQSRTGTISFLAFYRRRARRILPAAVLVIIATIAAGYFVLNGPRFSSLLTDAAFAALFSANWRAVLLGTDYFQATTAPSPLQHFWSLGVEEQFYLLWPWLLLATFVIVGRRSATRARWAGRLVVVAVVVASAVYAVWETQHSPTSAYFSTMSRAWELGAGALLAMFNGIFAGVSILLRRIAAWIGLLTIFLGYFVVSEASGFPAPWALIPVLGTMLVIAAGTGAFTGPILLVNPISNWLGDISYSLYVWHFPIITLAAAVMVKGSLQYFVVVGVLLLWLPVLSFYLVEDPIRSRRRPLVRVSSWLKSGPRYFAGATFDVSEAVVGAGLALTLLLALPIVYGLSLMRGSSPVESIINDPQLPASDGLTATQSDSWTNSISTALAAKTWPKDLSPTMDQAVAGIRWDAQTMRCASTSRPASDDACTWGTGSKTIMLVGDSTAVAYTPALRAMLRTHPHWRLVSQAMFGCRFTDVTFENDDPLVQKECPDRNRRALAAIFDTHPRLVVITNSYGGIPVGKSVAITPSTWQSHMQNYVAKIRAAGSYPVFLSSPPTGKDPQECYTKLSTPADCITTVSAAWASFTSTEIALAASGGAFLDSRSLVCYGYQCPEFIGQWPVKMDLNHITPQFSTALGPPMARLFESAKIDL